MEMDIEDQRRQLAQRSIKEYFDQLTIGCGNCGCGVTSCKSSSLYEYGNLSPNEAAIKAIILYNSHASKCITAKVPSTSEATNDYISISQSGSSYTSRITLDTPMDYAENQEESGASVDRSLSSILTDSRGNSDLPITSFKTFSGGDDSCEQGGACSSGQSVFNPDGDEDTGRRSAKQLRSDNSKSPVSSLRLPGPLSTVEYLTEEKLEAVISRCEASGNWSKLIHILGQVFSSADCLMHSFLHSSLYEEVREKADHEETEKKERPPPLDRDLVCSVDFDSLHRAIKRLFSLPDKDFYSSLLFALHSVCKSVQIELQRTKMYERQPNSLNLFLIMYELPLVLDPSHFEGVLPLVCRATACLPVSGQAQLCRVWAQHKKETLADLQKILMQLVTICCLTTEWDATGKGPNDDDVVCNACRVLKLVYYASLLAGERAPQELLDRESICNEQFERELLRHKQHSESTDNSCPPDRLAEALGIRPSDCRHPLIPSEEFVNETLNEYIQAEKDFMCYRQQNLEVFSFFHHSFLLTTETKSSLLSIDNRVRMMQERRGAFLQAIVAHIPQMPYLKLRIARDRVVEDALQGLEMATMDNPADLKKQLYIEFEGEQGIDEGGVSKEFFQLIIEKIFNPDFGMFTYDEETFTFWFNPAPVDDMEREYALIGTVLGLAIYNQVILDAHFPPVLYRKLMGKLGTLEDLETSHPSLYRGLQFLLEYEGDDLDEVFGYSFQVSYQDLFGSPVAHVLKSGGETTTLTQDNKHEFVKLYSDFLLNISIKRQFQAFHRGFQLVVDESPLKNLFRPEEIELLICGSKEYDFQELEKATDYEAEYSVNTPVIKNFWTVVHSMTEAQRRQLLQFTTGTDRVPVGGMKKMRFTIARQGPDSDRLPTAHTCFNVLLLPEYSSLEKLERCLLKAITYSQGFVYSEDGDININNLVNARATELQAFEADVNQLTASALNPLQRLPIRLRRRAASHRPNRVPRRLHVSSNNAEKANATSKRPKRKYRRRVRSLLCEYARRSRSCVWLDTHVWHARRFHMSARWGYKVPITPTDKVVRPSHRASTRGSMLVDLSYHACLELVGDEASILSGLSQLFPPQTGLHLSNPRFLEGLCELCGVLYAPNSYPYGAIGPGKLFWSPRTPTSNNRQVWLWLHPSIYSTVADHLRRIFNLQAGDSSLSDTTDPITKETITFACKSVSLTLLKGKLSRFRLLGPESHRVLVDLIRRHSEQAGDVSPSYWTAWERLSNLVTAENVPSNIVLSLSCTDPRYFRPTLKQKDRCWQLESGLNNLAVGLEEAITGLQWTADNAAESLWSKTYRDKMAEEFRSDFLVNTDLQSTTRRTESACSLILVHQSSSPGAGWDLVLPSCWARAFWLGLIYRGCHPAGLRELCRHGGLETGSSLDALFPDLCWPDTEAGKLESSREAKIKEKSFKNKPLKHRPHYNHWGTESPFHTPWEQLFPSTDDEKNHLNWFVLRDRSLLNRLVARVFSGEIAVKPKALLEYDSNLQGAIIQVRISSVGKGIPYGQAILCGATCPEDWTSPPTQLSLPGSPVRPLLGFSECGSSRLTDGKGSGLGFIGLWTLVKSIHSKQVHLWTSPYGKAMHILFKNPKTNVFRIARISIV